MHSFSWIKIILITNNQGDPYHLRTRIQDHHISFYTESWKKLTNHSVDSDLPQSNDNLKFWKSFLYHLRISKETRNSQKVGTHLHNASCSSSFSSCSRCVMCARFSWQEIFLKDSLLILQKLQSSCWLALARTLAHDTWENCVEKMSKIERRNHVLWNIEKDNKENIYYIYHRCVGCPQPSWQLVGRNVAE